MRPRALRRIRSTLHIITRSKHAQARAAWLLLTLLTSESIIASPWAGRANAQPAQVPSDAPTETTLPEVTVPPAAPPPPDGGAVEGEAALITDGGVAPGADAAVAADLVAEEQTALQAVRGRVVSTSDQAPIAGVLILAEGQDAQATTGEDGRFTIELAPGYPVLALLHSRFRTRMVQSRATAAADPEWVISLSPTPLSAERFVVTGQHLAGTVVALMDQRRATAAVTDAIGAEDIARMPASDAAQAAQRVVGATVVGGRYVYIRGLGERYTNAQLNGAPLPSPEPDRATIPLDLFPAQILDSLDISKTFTPDIPADFAGGSIRIVTRSMPDKPIFTASLTAGANTESTFAKGLGHAGGDTDWLGFDDGTRALSSRIPDDYPLILGQDRPGGGKVLSEELNQAGLALNTPMSVEEQRLLPNTSGSVVGGNGWQLGDDSKLGALASLTYSHSASLRTERIREYQSNASAEHGLQVINRYDAESLSEEVRWGAFGSVGIDITPVHRLRLLGMHSQLADKNTTVYDGYNQNTESYLASSRLSFASRSLDFGQLQGQHDFAGLNAATLQWSASLGLAQREQPDLRDVVYVLNPEVNRYIYANGSESGRHFFADQSENSYGLSIDWTQPITRDFFDSKVKLGGLLSRRDREFRARRFALRPAPRTMGELPLCGERYDPIGCPDAVFADENIGTLLRLEEGTRQGDSYNAGLDVIAGYLMADLGLGERARLVAGTRLEQTKQTLAPYDAFLRREIEDGGVELNQLDVLPAASIVYKFDADLALRLSGSRTLARPQLRELAPFAFSDYFNGVQVSGNPDLKVTGILNGDMRLEYFPTAGEVLAISVFAKDFSNPIEPIVRPSGTSNVLTYANAPGALLYGLELEARKKLDFIADALDGFTFIASAMFAHSEIEVRQTGTNFLTNLERPLVNQAPYVLNLALDYSASTGTDVRLLYNASGPTLVEVGSAGLDDVYQHPEHMLDLTASQALGEQFSIKLSVQNILNTEHVVTQGRKNRGYNVRYQYRDGVSGSVSLRFKL